MGMFTLEQLRDAINHEIEENEDERDDIIDKLLSNNEITCPTCNESWDHDTMGYAEAKERMANHDGLCPSCEDFE